MTRRKIWFGLKRRAVLSTGASAFVMLVGLLWHGSKELTRIEAEMNAQERARAIRTIQQLMSVWETNNKRLLVDYIKRFSRAANNSADALRSDLKRMLNDTEYDYATVSVSYLTEGRCYNAVQDGWGGMRSCTEVKDGYIYCSDAGCCKYYVIADDNKGIALSACFELSNAFIGQEGWLVPLYRLITPGSMHPVREYDYIISKELNLPQGLGIGVLKSGERPDDMYKRVVLKFLALGSVAIVSVLLILSAALYSRLSKIRYIIEGFDHILSGNVAGFDNVVSCTTSRSYLDEIDLIVNKQHETLNMLMQSREADKKLTVEKTRRELIEAHYRERMQLTAQMAKAAEAEKAEIARELHDEVGQAIVSIRVDASLIRKVASDNNEIQERANRIGQTCERLGHSIRHIIEDLRPPAIDTHGLKETLQELVREWQQRMQGQTHFNTIITDDVNDISVPLQSTVYRIVQEAITNIAKHANAHNVNISVRTDKYDALPMVIIDIKDDGVGIRPNNMRAGRGLSGMRERVMANEGVFEIASEQGKGVSVHCALPVRPER